MDYGSNLPRACCKQVIEEYLSTRRIQICAYAGFAAAMPLSSGPSGLIAPPMLPMTVSMLCSTPGCQRWERMRHAVLRRHVWAMHSVPLQQAHHAPLAPGIEGIFTICTEDTLSPLGTGITQKASIIGTCNSIGAYSGDDHDR